MNTKIKAAILGMVTTKGRARPILNNCVLDDRGLFITDLQASLSMQSDLIGYARQFDGSACIDVHQLLKFASSRDSFFVQTDGNTALLKSGKTTMKLPAFARCEYPEPFDDVHSDTVELVTEDLAKAIRSSIIYANTDESRFSLNSIMFDFRNGYIVSTDQIRLRLMKIDKHDRDNVIIQLKHAKVLLSIVDSKLDLHTSIWFSDKTVEFFGAKWSMQCEKLDVQFPNYMGATENYVNEFKGYCVSAPVLIDELEDLELCLCKGHRNVKLEGNKFTLSSPTGEIAIESSLVNPYSEPVGINYYFVLDYLKDLKKNKTDAFTLAIISPRKPIIMKDGDNYHFMSPTAV